jgi:hypothetical protein
MEIHKHKQKTVKHYTPIGDIETGSASGVVRLVRGTVEERI